MGAPHSPLLPSVGCGCISLSCLDGVERSGSESLSFQAAPFWPLGSGSCWFSWVTVGAQALDGSQGPAPPPVCRSSLSVFSHGCQAWSPGSQWNSAGGVGRCTPLFWEPKSTLVFLLNGRLVCLSGEPCFPLLLCLPTSGLVLVPEPWSGQPRTAPRAPACPWARTWGHRC